MKRRLTRKDRVGLFGGTFDPIHLGHLHLGENFCQFGPINEVIFVPARIPPHKQDQFITPENHRLAMLRLALKGHKNFHISNFEIQRPSISYSFNTALHFKNYFGDNVYILIGMDSLCELHTWFEAKRLVNEFKFIDLQSSWVECAEYEKTNSIFWKIGRTKASSIDYSRNRERLEIPINSKLALQRVGRFRLSIS